MFSDCHCPNLMYKLHFTDSQNTTKHKKYTVNYLVYKLVVTFLTPSKPTTIIQTQPFNLFQWTLQTNSVFNVLSPCSIFNVKNWGTALTENKANNNYLNFFLKRTRDCKMEVWFFFTLFFHSVFSLLIFPLGDFYLWGAHVLVYFSLKAPFSNLIKNIRNVLTPCFSLTVICALHPRCGHLLQHLLLPEAALFPGQGAQCWRGCSAWSGCQSCGWCLHAAIHSHQDTIRGGSWWLFHVVSQWSVYSSRRLLTCDFIKWFVFVIYSASLSLFHYEYNRP